MLSPQKGLGRLLFGRLLEALLLVFLILTILFFAVRLAPGEPAVFYDNPQLPAEQREILRQTLNLDRPLVLQYLAWLRSVALRFDWGYSLSFSRPVTQLLLERLPATLVLSGAALFLQFFLGILLGVAAARRAGTIGDRAIRTISLTVYALPTFWLGVMALLALSYRLPLFPGSGMRSVGAADLSFWARQLDLLHHLALPALVLGISSAGAISRFVRNNLLDVLENDYIRTARAKGLGERTVVWVHGLANSLTSLTQLAGLSLPFLFGGALVVEVVFSWPGMGRLTWNALLSQDYPLILGATGLSALMVIAGTLLSDLLLLLAVPRSRHG